MTTPATILCGDAAGLPCNRCGKCCEEFPCPLAGGAGPDGKCRVFYRERGKACCGLYGAARGVTRENIGKLLKIGEGCTEGRGGVTEPRPPRPPRQPDPQAQGALL